MRLAFGDHGMALLGVVRAVPTNTADGLIGRDLRQQIGEDRGIADRVGGDFNSPDIQRFRVDPNMDLAPLATIGSAVLAGFPLAFTHHLDPSAVDQEMQTARTGPTAKHHRQRLLTSAQRRIIRHRPVQISQLEQARYQSRRLSQRQIEQRFQRQAQLARTV